MRYRAYPLDFNQQGNMFRPANPELHRMAVEFAQKEMGWEQPSFIGYSRTWVCCELDDNDKPVKVTGLSCMRLVPDVEQLRFANAKAAHVLVNRMHDYLQDQRVALGSDVFVRIVDGEDPHRCPNYQDWLKLEKARPAERWVLPSR